MRASFALPITGAAVLSLHGMLCAQAPAPSDTEFFKHAKQLRADALHAMDPRLAAATYNFAHGNTAKYPWKTGIVTTVFGIGSAKKGKGASGASAWDPQWQANYGGFDDPNPAAREHYLPKGFTPRLNPFYVALPYNDVGKGATKPEARVVIPWFKESFAEEGKSVCRDRWVLIRNSAGKVCYAQWADSGPYGADHWQYVFGNEKPHPNANGGAGLNVSPAVRDYLGLSTTDVTDWKFVETEGIPDGPWSLHGANNPLVRPVARPQEPHTAEALRKGDPLPDIGAGPSVEPAKR